MERQVTCKERVRGYYRARMDDLGKLWAAYQDGKPDIPDLGSIFDYGLCFDYVAPGTFRDQKRGFFRYQISYGGPQDEFRFFCDETRTPVKVEYWFLDWFDGAKITAQGKNLSLLLELFDWFKESGTVDDLLNKSLDD